MRCPSHFAIGLLGCALSAPGVARCATASVAVHWQARGEGIDAEAVWRSTGPLRLSLRCEASSPRLSLRLSGAGLPATLSDIVLAADTVEMRYPVERVGTASSPAFVSKIALDAPILDRVLVARVFTVTAGDALLQTDAPGPTLAPVVRACRSRHWPRDASARGSPSPRAARIASSDAGLAKK